MPVRLLLALIAACGLTAFAPAPFPKPARGTDPNEDLLVQLQGNWQITKKVRKSVNGQMSNYSTTMQLQITKANWQFIYPNRNIRITTPQYRLVVDPSGSPRRFRVKRTTAGGTDYMVGIVEVKGDTVKMLYRIGTSSTVAKAKPTSFDDIPQGWYQMTLKRSR